MLPPMDEPVSQYNRTQFWFEKELVPQALEYRDY